MVDVFQPVTSRKPNAVDFNIAPVLRARGWSCTIFHFLPFHYIFAVSSTNQVKLVTVNVWYLGSLVKRNAHLASITPIDESQPTQTMQPVPKTAILY